jgi:hypothetical protein
MADTDTSSIGGFIAFGFGLAFMGTVLVGMIFLTTSVFNAAEVIYTTPSKDPKEKENIGTASGYCNSLNTSAQRMSMAGVIGMWIIFSTALVFSIYMGFKSIKTGIQLSDNSSNEIIRASSSKQAEKKSG